MNRVTHKFDGQSGTLNLSVDGDVLSTNIEALRSEIFQLLDGRNVPGPDWNTLDLDITKAQMIDSAGLNLLVLMAKFIKNRGSRMAVKVSNPNVHRTFVFTRLDRHLDLALV